MLYDIDVWWFCKNLEEAVVAKSRHYSSLLKEDQQMHK
jgi:hypothetical protein